MHEPLGLPTCWPGSICRVTSPQTNEPAATLKVLVYSDDVDTREQVILALGKRPHPDLPELEYVEVATEPVVIQQMDAGGILWAAGDLIGLAFFGVLFAQWVRSSMKEAAREDRRLDLLEARATGSTAGAPGPVER